MDCVFKIQNEYGLFSNGNVRKFKWSKRGVVFKSKIQLSAHLRAMLEYGILPTYNGCKLLSYTLDTPTIITLDDVIEDLLIKKCIEELKA